jgi:hypothetical protein
MTARGTLAQLTPDGGGNKHTTHNGRHDDDQSAHTKCSSKTQKQKDVQVAACLIPASYWESISSVQFRGGSLSISGHGMNDELIDLPGFKTCAGHFSKL